MYHPTTMANASIQTRSSDLVRVDPNMTYSFNVNTTRPAPSHGEKRHSVVGPIREWSIERLSKVE